MALLGGLGLLAMLAFLGMDVGHRVAGPGQRRRRDLLRIAGIPSGFDDLRVAIGDEERLGALIDADRSMQVNEPRDVRPLYTQEGVQEQLLRSEIGSLVSREDMETISTVATGPQVSLTQLLARAGL